MFSNYLDYQIKDRKLAAEVEEYASREPHTHSTEHTRETLAALREDNLASAKAFKFDKQEELERVRLGHTMTAREFLAKLNKIIPAYYTAQSKRGLLKLVVLVPSLEGGQLKFICGAQPGIVPEWSTLYTDSHGLPTSEKYRGWRTVLLRLIAAGVVDERAVEKVFGRPEGPEARRYLETLYGYRNRKAEID